MPFSDLDMNTVYMYLAALCNNLFEFLKRVLVDNKMQQINVKQKTKRVFFLFIAVCATVRIKARQRVVQFFNSNEISTKLFNSNPKIFLKTNLPPIINWGKGDGLRRIQE